MFLRKGGFIYFRALSNTVPCLTFSEIFYLLYKIFISLFTYYIFILAIVLFAFVYFGAEYHAVPEFLTNMFR